MGKSFGKTISSQGKGFVAAGTGAARPVYSTEVDAVKKFGNDAAKESKAIQAHGMSYNPGESVEDRMAFNRRAEQIAAEQAQLKQDQMLKDLPQLQNRIGTQTLGDAGQFKASQIAQSPWASMAMQKQGLDQAMAGDALAKTNAMQAAQGRAALGRIGGGGAERAGLSSMLSSAQGREGLMVQGNTARQGIAQQGAGRGLDIAQFNAGQAQQANQANVGQSIKDLNNENAFNRLKYGEQMKFVGGQQTGAAMDKAGGGKK